LMGVKIPRVSTRASLRAGRRLDNIVLAALKKAADADMVPADEDRLTRRPHADVEVMPAKKRANPVVGIEDRLLGLARVSAPPYCTTPSGRGRSA
jgi:hypothetical protein